MILGAYIMLYLRGTEVVHWKQQDVLLRSTGVRTCLKASKPHTEAFWE